MLLKFDGLWARFSDDDKVETRTRSVHSAGLEQYKTLFETLFIHLETL
jgi:hypothetical protein